MDIQKLLGDEAEALLSHESKGIPKEDLSLPGPDFIDRVMADTDRSPQVLRNLQALFSHGRLGGTGYVSILPVDQGIEHSAAASFALRCRVPAGVGSSWKAAYSMPKTQPSARDAAPRPSLTMSM